jgi:diacylglycerol diphosphate phosphatase / phosphatidate phosphatase
MGRFFTPSSHPKLARFARAHLAWFRSALIVDWIVMVALLLLSFKVEATYPYERDVEHYLGDNDISWKHTVIERVSVALLDDLAFKLPALLVVLIAAMKLSLHDLHHGLLALCSSRALMRLAVEGIKNRVQTFSRRRRRA